MANPDPFTQGCYMHGLAPLLLALAIAFCAGFICGAWWNGLPFDAEDDTDA